MIGEFSHASVKDIVFNRIDQSILVWMHGDSHVRAPNEFSYLLETAREIVLPIKCAYGMRGEWNKTRSYPKEKQIVVSIELQCSGKAFKIVFHGFDQSLSGVGLESESSTAAASYNAIDARVADSRFLKTPLSGFKLRDVRFGLAQEVAVYPGDFRPTHSDTSSSLTMTSDLA